MSRGEDEELRASTTAVDSTAAALAQLEVSAADCAATSALPESSMEFPDFTDDFTAPELRAMWSEPDSSDVPVRGETYMDDQLKVPAGASVARLLHLDVWKTETPEARHHITRFDLERPGDRSIVRFCETHHPDSLVVVLNIELPDSDNVSLVAYWLVPKFKKPEEELEQDEHATFYRLLRRFVDEEDDAKDTFRNERFKLIPSFTQAPWVLNQLVQSRPALTGKKLTQRYFRGPNYVEVAMDVSSSTIAHYIGSMCQSWATYIEVDVFIAAQGEQQDELPEKILGGVRLQYMDLSFARCIDKTFSGEEDQDEDDE
jgi:hypothetical protein